MYRQCPEMPIVRKKLQNGEERRPNMAGEIFVLRCNELNDLQEYEGVFADRETYQRICVQRGGILG